MASGLGGAYDKVEQPAFIDDSRRGRLFRRARLQGRSMRGEGVVLATALFGLALPASAQEAPEESTRTAEEYIETAREYYHVEKPKPPPCPEATAAEIVVYRESYDGEDQRLGSPTDRAIAAGEKPPDRIPDAPYVLGLPECGVEVTCHRMGRAPPPIYIVDFSKIPEALTPEEAAHVFRAEDLPAESTPAEASPTAAP